MEKPRLKRSLIEWLDELITNSGQTHDDVADRCGFRSTETLTMVLDGRAKLPFKSIAPLAEALGADPAHLLRLAMLEYAPEMWEAMEEILTGTTLTAVRAEVKVSHRAD